MGMTIGLGAFFLVLFFTAMYLYFNLAQRFGIMDIPNSRSSHLNITIRGGGIIFLFALLMYPLWFGFEYIYFLIGVFLVGVVSFIDDINPISNKIRFSVHIVAALLIFLQLKIFDLPLYVICASLIIIVGIINAFNFMDGINGLSGLYSFVTILTLLYINNEKVEFVSNNVLLIMIFALIVFNFFNFRTKATCFAGDVGSITIAFFIIFLLFKLTISSDNLSYFLFIILYGLDTLTTILFRLLRRENIFEAHRTHYYQYLVNERGIKHLYISIIYAFVQVVFNLLIILFNFSFLQALVFVIIIFVLFIILRFKSEGTTRLLGR